MGLRQGATENATVVGELLGDLARRGFDFSQTRLYVRDGGKALSAAVKTHAGESALIQRCQVHKRRNVLDHLPEDQKSLVAQKLNAAYATEDYDAAKLAQVAPRVDGLQSECGTELVGRDGGNAHGA